MNAGAWLSDRHRPWKIGHIEEVALSRKRLELHSQVSDHIEKPGSRSGLNGPIRTRPDLCSSTTQGPLHDLIATLSKPVVEAGGSSGPMSCSISLAGQDLRKNIG